MHMTIVRRNGGKLSYKSRGRVEWLVFHSKLSQRENSARSLFILLWARDQRLYAALLFFLERHYLPKSQVED